MAKLSVDRIVAEAGVSRATFYVCFPDKQAVVGRLAQEALAWREDIHTEVLSDPRPHATAHGRTHARDRRLLAGQPSGPRGDHRARRARPAMRDPWRAAVTEIAEQAAEQFRIRWRKSPDRPRNPDAMAAVVTWMMERARHQLVTDDVSAKTVALAMSEIIWRNLTFRAKT